MPIYRFDPFVFDTACRSLRAGDDGDERELRYKTACLLQCFLQRPDHLWSKDELLEAVWDDVVVGEAVVFQTLSELRKELAAGTAEKQIQTVKGKGYRWVGSSPELLDGAPEEPEAEAKPTTAGPTRGNRFGQVALGLAAVLILVVGLGWIWQQSNAPAVPDDGQEPRVLLLSDRSPDDPIWMGETRRGLLLMVTTLLGSSGGVETVMLDSSDQWIFKSAEDLQTKARAASHLTELLGVRYVVFTDLSALGDGAYRVGYSVYAGERRLESDAFDGDSLLSGAEDLAAKIADALKVPAPNRQVSLSFSNDGRALNAFSEGEQAYERGDMAIAVGWFEKALSLDPEFPWAQVALARAREDQGEAAAAESLLHEALTAARASEDFYLQVECLNLLARQALRSGNSEALLDYQRQIQEAAWRWGDRRVEASALRMQGNYHMQLRAFDEAVSSYEASLKVAESAGDRVAVAHAVNNLGAVALQRQDLESARNFFTRAVDAYGELGNSWFQVGPLANLGMVARQLGEPDAAEQHLQQALKLSRENGNPAYSARILSSLGLLRSTEGDKEQAAQAIEESFQLLREIKDDAGAARVGFNLAQVYLDLERFDLLPELLTFCEQQLGTTEPHLFVLWAEYHDRVQEPRLAFGRMKEAKAASRGEWSEEHEARLDLYHRKWVQDAGRPVPTS